MKNGIVVRGGRVVDPSMNLDNRLDIRICNGVVAAVGRLKPCAGERVIDASGLVVAPGLIDVHVHLREPGQEWKETIGTGTAAAAAGGFTTIFCMPNTEPALDSVAALEELKRRTDRDASVSVRPIAAISEGRLGRVPVDYEGLAKSGAVGFSDDGDTTRDSAIMRCALQASARVGVPVMVHCEDPALAGGAMHDGAVSRELGLRGLPAMAEEIVIQRDLALAAETGGWLHVCHVSTGLGAGLVAAAQEHKTRVSAEVMPHHLTMTDDWVAGKRCVEDSSESVPQDGSCVAPDAKVNPPLRTRNDTRQLLKALRDGVIEIVATDHAPHSLPEKRGRAIAQAAFGLSGSEFGLPLMLALVRAGHLSMSEMIRAMSSAPARLWGLTSGTLRPGAPADVVLFDPEERWTVYADQCLSRSSNTPLLGVELRGRTKLTIVNGDERYRDW